MKRYISFFVFPILLIVFTACVPISPIQQGNVTTTSVSQPTFTSDHTLRTTTQNTLTDFSDSTTATKKIDATRTTLSDSVNVEDLLPTSVYKSSTTTTTTTVFHQQTITKPLSSTTKPHTTTGITPTTATTTMIISSTSSTRVTDKWDNVTIETDSGWSPIV